MFNLGHLKKTHSYWYTTHSTQHNSTHRVVKLDSIYFIFVLKFFNHLNSLSSKTTHIELKILPPVMAMHPIQINTKTRAI